MARTLPLLLAGVAAAVGPVGTAGAEPRTLASFEDAAGDGYGPGSYLPPGDPEFTDGDFDLRRFAVRVDGDDVLFEVTLGASFRRPALAQRTNAVPLALDNGIYLQNVDIYLDTDPAPGAGVAACIPGRRVAFADGRTWEVAVVLTPEPRAAREVIRAALGEAAARVVLPGPLLTRGRTLVARVPAAALGGLPRGDWGYSVHVSGARWERTYALSDRLRGREEADAFTMPVRSAPEAWAFGGAPSGKAHPRVVDVLLPAGTDQRTVLSAFDARTATLARVPFVFAVAAPPAPARAATDAASERGFEVVEVSGDLVTLSGASAGMARLRLGTVLGPDGATLARVVVVEVVEGGLVARIVEGRERVVPGATVRFATQP